MGSRLCTAWVGWGYLYGGLQETIRQASGRITGRTHESDRERTSPRRSFRNRASAGSVRQSHASVFKRTSVLDYGIQNRPHERRSAQPPGGSIANRKGGFGFLRRRGKKCDFEEHHIGGRTGPLRTKN